MLWKNLLINRLGNLVIITKPRQTHFFHDPIYHCECTGIYYIQWFRVVLFSIYCLATQFITVSALEYIIFSGLELCYSLFIAWRPNFLFPIFFTVIAKLLTKLWTSHDWKSLIYKKIRGGNRLLKFSHT